MRSRLVGQAIELERHMRVPVVHAGSTLSLLDQRLGTVSVRRVANLDYDVT